jgi:two-component system sensor histidine kinase/response regulator
MRLPRSFDETPMSLVEESRSEDEVWALRADGDLQRTLLGDAIDEAAVLMFVADDEAKYLAVNAYACKVLGYSREEVLGMTVPEIAVDPRASALYKAMVDQGGGTGLTPIRCRDGRLLQLRYWASPVTIAGTDFWASIGVIETARNEAAG